MTLLSASPLAHALNDLSEESLTSIARTIDSGRPGLTAPEKQVQELLDAGIVEHAKDGISEFPLRIPADVWERINQLGKLVDRLRRDGRLGPNKLRMIEESCDRDLAASKSAGGAVGWTASIVYFLATRMAFLEGHLCKTGIVTRPLIEAQHRGMAGVAEDHIGQFSFEIVHRQHRHVGPPGAVPGGRRRGRFRGVHRLSRRRGRSRRAVAAYPKFSW